MLDMPFADGFAGVLLCFNVMHHLSDKEQYLCFLNQCYRVLKKRGHIFFVEPEDNFIRKLQDLLLRVPLLSDIPILKGQKVAVFEEKEQIGNFCRIDILKLLTDSGFSIIEKRSFLKSFILSARKI